MLNVADETLKNQSSKKSGCSLDYFTVDDYRYINLLFVDHKDHDSLGNVFIKKFTNIDFCLTKTDYNRLNSLIRQYGSSKVTGGIDTESQNILKILVNGNIQFEITAVLPVIHIHNPINPEYTSSN